VLTRRLAVVQFIAMTATCHGLLGSGFWIKVRIRQFSSGQIRTSADRICTSAYYPWLTCLYAALSVSCNRVIVYRQSNLRFFKIGNNMGNSELFNCNSIYRKSTLNKKEWSMTVNKPTVALSCYVSKDRAMCIEIRTRYGCPCLVIFPFFTCTVFKGVKRYF